jgi:cytochrome P450
MGRRDQFSDLPRGPRLPRALQLVATWKRPAGSLERLRQRYGKRFTVRIPFQPPFVMLSDPDDIKELFTASPEAIHPGEGARVLEPTVGSHSVILLDEGVHMEQRKLLLPAFHGERMQRLMGLMTELAEHEVASWPLDEPVQLHPRLQSLTLEIILRAVFGLEQGPRLDELRGALKEILVFAESPLSVLPPVTRVVGRFVPSLRRIGRASERADRLIFELVEERRVAAADNGHGDDVLAMLLAARHEDGTPMSDQEIRDELMTALVAGHETTASQLAWAFEQLAREPRVVTRLVEEADGGDDYLMATIYEVMRLRPVLPNAEPRLTKQPVEIGGVRYPAGVSLLACAFLVHRDPEIYPQPHAFRPERFLEQPQPDDPGGAESGAAGSRVAKPGTYTWIPFGGGRRRCLGASFALQEMKVVIRAVLRRFELVPAGAPETTGRRSITFSPSRGATVVLRERVPAAAAAGPATAAAAGAPDPHQDTPDGPQELVTV